MAKVGTVVSNIPMLILGVRELSVLLCRYNTIHKAFSLNSVTQSSPSPVLVQSAVITSRHRGSLLSPPSLHIRATDGSISRV